MSSEYLEVAKKESLTNTFGKDEIQSVENQGEAGRNQNVKYMNVPPPVTFQQPGPGNMGIKRG